MSNFKSDKVELSIRRVTLSIFQKIVFGLLLVFSGHSYALEPSGSVGPQCPSQDFSDFLRAFGESVEIQKAFTQYPLKHVQVVDATSEPLPKVSVRHLKKSNIKFPIFLSQNHLADYGLKVESENRKKGIWAAIERSAGERSLGHYIEYKFVQKNGCWNLVEINDQST